MTWVEDLRRYCRQLNIESEDLYSILSDLKVAPMIRGKAFEFSVASRLKKLLSPDVWEISKPIMNAQTGVHDVDVLVLHTPTSTQIRVECKLAQKGGFRVRNGHYIVPVKCMRSRTTKTLSKAETGARQLGVTTEQFLAHSDQYRVTNFDVVITSLGNAFYQTVEDEDGNATYQFQAGEDSMGFIQKLNPTQDVQAFVYNKLYLARSADIAATETSGVVCRKKECTDKKSCGFIPNYPVIDFGEVSQARPTPLNHWVGIENAAPVFESFIPIIKKS